MSVNTAVFVSGGGRSLENLLRQYERGCQILISESVEAYYYLKR